MGLFFKYIDVDKLIHDEQRKRVVDPNNIIDYLDREHKDTMEATIPEMAPTGIGICWSVCSG